MNVRQTRRAMRDLGALTAVDTVKEMKGGIRDFWVLFWIRFFLDFLDHPHTPRFFCENSACRSPQNHILSFAHLCRDISSSKLCFSS
jgi:hypothetical protein